MTRDYFSWLAAIGVACAVFWGATYIDGDHHPDNDYCTTTSHVDQRGRPCELPRRADRSR